MLFMFMIFTACCAALALWVWGNRSSLVAPPRLVSVVGAAIRYSDLGVIALPLPKSHEDLRELVDRLHGSRGGKHRGETGYITSQGGFVRGREALVIARQARQLRDVWIRGDVLEVEYLSLLGKNAEALTRTQSPAADCRQRSAPPRHSGAAHWMTRATAAGQVATNEYLFRQFLKTALITVLCLFLAGLISLQFGVDRFSGVLFSGFEGSRIASLSSAVPVVQCALYVLLGLGLATVIHARGAQLRGPAVAAFLALVAVNLLWAFSFNAEVDAYATLLAAAMVVLAPLTVALFGYIRLNAALLTVPSLAWAGLATYSTLHVYLGAS